MKRLKNLAGLLTRKRPPVGTTPADAVHAENKWKLLRYRRSSPAKFRTPVLFVPSLINRHYVLDLLPGKSFAEWLVAQGHDVYCIDWGTPGAEDKFLTFDEVADGYIGRAIRKTAATAGSEKAHVLGYCMGGTLAAIHAAAHPERLASLVALAAPVRFSEAGMLGLWTQSPQFEPKTLVEALGNVPWQLLQSSFHMLRPTMNLSKVVHMIDRAYENEFLDGFLALETWGNDNVSFPGEVWRKWVEELYRGDAFARGELSLSGRPALMQNVDCPLLVVTFEHDNIVPRPSAAPLLELSTSPDKQELHMSGGHVGAVVSRGAAKKLWPALGDFWGKRDGAVAGGGKVKVSDAPPSRPRARSARPASGSGSASPRRRSTASR
jgi:polyhydroxyalkanoate synthase